MTKHLLCLLLGLWGGFMLHCESPTPRQGETTQEPITTDVSREPNNNDVGADVDAGFPEQSKVDMPGDAGQKEGPGPSPISFVWDQDDKVAYHRRWSWKGARWDADAKAHVFTNQKGFTFGIEKGYVSLVAMQMVACSQPESAGTLGALFPWLRVGLRRARADHSFTEDSSVVSLPTVEVLMEEAYRHFGNAVTSGVTYCQIHGLYAPLSAKAADGTEVKRTSAMLKGWYKISGSEQKVPFEASTALTGGSLIALTQGSESLRKSLSPVGEDVQAHVLWERNPVVALQEADPVAMDGVELAYHFLQRLSRATTAVVLQGNTP